MGWNIWIELEWNGLEYLVELEWNIWMELVTNGQEYLD
jgi:hypothetical protein